MATSVSTSEYDYNFIVEPDSALKCVICLSVAKEPLQHERCGKLFCKECIEKYGKDKPCPNCKTRGSQFYVDNRSRRDIQALCVKCDVDRNCKWVGTINALEKHVATCRFTLLPCPRQCRDSRNKVKQLMRKDLDEHLKNGCPNSTVLCPEKCKDSSNHIRNFLRKDLGAHLKKKCPNVLLPCPKKCEEDNEVKRLMRKDLEKHIKEDCPNRNYTCEYCGKKGTYATITEVHDLECTKFIIVPTPEQPWEEITRRLFSIDYQEIVVSCKYEKIGCKVKMKRKYMAGHELFNKHHLQMAVDTVVKLKEDTYTLCGGILIIIVVFFYFFHYKKDQCYIVENEGNKLSVSQQVTTFKVPDFYRMKNDEVFTSPHFYTSPAGYHMAIKVHPGRGWGEDRYLSFSILVLEGNYDAKLKWPFVGNVTITLLNQVEDKNHFDKVVVLTRIINVRTGRTLEYPNFFRYSILKADSVMNTQYLKNNALYFKISIDTHNFKPWLECTAKYQ